METDKAKELMIKILKNYGIEMEVFGCGCCGSPTVSFSWNGESLLKDEDSCNFSTNEEKNEELDE